MGFTGSTLCDDALKGMQSVNPGVKGALIKRNPTTANIQQVANKMTSKCRTMLTWTMRGRWWPNNIYKFSS